MIQKLYESGGNRVWETLLLDPNKESKNKLRVGDSSERREIFIKDKYVYQGMDCQFEDLFFSIDMYCVDPDSAFFNKDEEACEDRYELSRQLFSVVRTNQLGPALRFLAHGMLVFLLFHFYEMPILTLLEKTFRGSCRLAKQRTRW